MRPHNLPELDNFNQNSPCSCSNGNILQGVGPSRFFRLEVIALPANDLKRFVVFVWR